MRVVPNAQLSSVKLQRRIACSEIAPHSDNALRSVALDNSHTAPRALCDLLIVFMNHRQRGGVRPVRHASFDLIKTNQNAPDPFLRVDQWFSERSLLFGPSFCSLV